MKKAKTCKAENITIICDKRCPSYYCSEPCRVKEHVEKYSKIIRSGYRVLDALISITDRKV